MAELHDLIEKIENPELRAQIQAAADRLTKQKKFGLVFEEHLPECTPLYDIPVRKGLKVSVRNGRANETYTVLKIEDPLFVNEDGTKIVSVGESIPLGVSRETVQAPDGTKVVWPIRSNGEEG